MAIDVVGVGAIRGGWGYPMITVVNAHDLYVPSLLVDANIPLEHEAEIARFIRFSPQCWAGFHDNQFACMWGLIPPTLLSTSAYLWLVVGELVEEHKFIFVRQSQLEVAKMLEIFPEIVGHCDVRHERSMQWLKWLGAKFDYSQGPACPFTITRK